MTIVDLTETGPAEVRIGDAVLVPGTVVAVDQDGLGPVVAVADRVRRGTEVHFETASVTVDPEFLELTRVLDELVEAGTDPSGLMGDEVASSPDAYSRRLSAVKVAAAIAELDRDAEPTPARPQFSVDAEHGVAVAAIGADECKAQVLRWVQVGRHERGRGYYGGAEAYAVAAAWADLAGALAAYNGEPTGASGEGA